MWKESEDHNLRLQKTGCPRYDIVYVKIRLLRKKTRRTDSSAHGSCLEETG